MLLNVFSNYLARDNDLLIVAPPRTALLLARLAPAALRDHAGVNASVKGSSYIPLGYGRSMHMWLKKAVVLLAARVEAKTTLMVDELSSMLVKEEQKRDDNLVDPHFWRRSTVPRPARFRAVVISEDVIMT